MAVDVALGLIGVGVALTVVRLVAGPTVADRVVASDALVTQFVLVALLAAARLVQDAFLVVALVVALVGFIATAAYARFLEAEATADPVPAEPGPEPSRGPHR